jgi:tRNA U34 5-methylaminomethyl-2-thiouridine-forming methyltransferase MnmC
LQKNKLSLTEDGSHSIFSEKYQALYHSKHGAIQESEHVFINAGLQHSKLDHPSILEMGFGTGLNALLTMIHCANSSQVVHYETVEAYPLEISQIKKLNYLEELKVSSNLRTNFMRLHELSWGEIHQFPKFTFRKHLLKLEEVNLDHKFDIVFYDAFAPLTQEELWTPKIFQHLSQFLNQDAILVSYCAKGSFKRALMSAGFKIEKIPGPPGKREMIRGTYRTEQNF